MSDTHRSAKKVIVVGGGVAGLATAYLIRQQARARGQALDLTVLEAKNRHGGATRTDRVEGYTCEWGPNGFLDNEPATLELVRMLNLDNELVRADESAANRYIYHGGKMRIVPMKPPQFLTSDILPLPAKLRMAMEILVPAKRNGAEETVDQFGKRRLGAAFARTMLDPMVSGIFAGDTARLSLQAVFPKMVAMERAYGGLFRAMLAKRRAAKKSGGESGGPSGPKGTLHTFRNGMGVLTDTLFENLAASVRTGIEAQQLYRFPGGGFMLRTSVGALDADEVVLACPAPVAASILADLDKAVSRALADIHHAPVDVVCHGHGRKNLTDPLHGFGVLIPRSEGIRSLGTLWSDSIFPGQAPPDNRLLRTILGGAHDTGITQEPDEELHAIAHRDHRTVMGVQGEPAFKRSYRHPLGIAQYTLGHLDRVAKTEALEKEMPGLYFTGASYRGVSINGCIKDAFRVADMFH